MNKTIMWLVLLWVCAGAQRLQAQSVTVEAKIDSLQILIGEQTKMQLQVALDSKDHASLPLLKDTLVRGVEILETSKIDTQYLNNNQRMILTQDYIITSFDSALYYLPPLSVMVSDKAYKSNALALKVYSVPIDEENPQAFFGPKTVMKPPFLWEDWVGIFILSILMIPLVGVLIYLFMRLRDNKPIIRKVKIEPKIPPHVLAMQHIDKVKQEKIWQKGEAKVYYTELTDIIRNYIKERFDFNALEMTSSEIIDKLMEIGSDKDINELKELFQTADLVKFAKHNPLINESDANLIYAIEFINETKVVEPENQKPQPTEITIIEKRSLRAKIILLCSIAVLALVAIASLVYIISELIDLV